MPEPAHRRGSYPADVRVEPAARGRNRLTTFFRIPLSIPHLLLVGGPMAATLSWETGQRDGLSFAWGGAGLLGAVAVLCAWIAWFAILITTRHPQGLWDLAAYYLRWRVRAVAYIALLRDEYPPFGEHAYPVGLELARPDAPRDRLTVAFRVILAIPHIIAVWVLGLAWGLTTLIAWVAILITGDYPEPLYTFGLGVLRWNTRVEAYLLLLRDEYPPFALD